MKTIFFDVGYTLFNEDAVWETRCKEQAETEEAKKLGLSYVDFLHEIRKATILWLPQYRTVIKKYNLHEVVPYKTELETIYKDAPEVLKALSKHFKLAVPDSLYNAVAEAMTDE